MNVQETGNAVGQLIALALTPRARPGKDPAYQDLIKRYRSDADFRILTTATAEGLGLIVLGVGPTGMVLGCRDDGPFAMRTGDYRVNMKVEDRIVHGLIQLAIAAWCFPNAEDLEDDDAVVRHLSVREVVAHLVRTCRELEARAEADPELGEPVLREAWRVVLARPEARETPDARRTASSLHGMVAYALEKLASSGLARRESDERWVTTRAYRLQIRELAAHAAFRLVREAARREL